MCGIFVQWNTKVKVNELEEIRQWNQYNENKGCKRIKTQLHQTTYIMRLFKIKGKLTNMLFRDSQLCDKIIKKNRE